jgi:hypothetical protein
VRAGVADQRTPKVYTFAVLRRTACRSRMETAEKYSFCGALNGGVIGPLLDCHCNWTATYHLMKRAKADRPHVRSRRNMPVKFLRPARRAIPSFFREIVDLTDDRATGRNFERGRKSLRHMSRSFRRGKGRPSRISSLVEQRMSGPPVGRTRPVASLRSVLMARQTQPL